MAKIIDPDDLTYIVNGSPTSENIQIDTTGKTIRLVAGGNLVAQDGITGQCLFSKIKEIIKASSALISVPLPIREMIHDESMELINDWKMYDSTSLKMIRDCGLAYVNTAGAITAMYADIITLGRVSSGTTTQLYFVQDSATNAATSAFTYVNTDTTFGANELVQIYSDPNGDGNVSDGYDKRSYFKVFLRKQGYTYDESSSLDIGASALTYKAYRFPITHAVDAGVTVDDTTVDGYTGMSIEWFTAAQSFSLGTNGPYDYHVVITANNHTYAETYSWVQRQLRKATDIDAGATTRTGAVTPALVRMDGSILKTLYQTQGGVHISSISAASYNNVQESDDTDTLRSYPLSISVIAEFDTYLQNDADSYFWIFATADYGTPGASPLLDSGSNPMEGAANTPSVSFAKTYTTDIPLTGVALGKSGAKIAISTTTLTNQGAKLVFVAGLERWYVNPV